MFLFFIVFFFTDLCIIDDNERFDGVLDYGLVRN